MKIKLFTHKDCVKCRGVKRLLNSILPELGMAYETAIDELDIGDPDALADLTMLDTEFVPTINIGDAVLTGEKIMNETVLRNFIKAHMKKVTG
jgi:glutaredoxin